jgi:hypothetical protein
MTNANPARGQKSARRKNAREMHAEQPKFQAGQRVAWEDSGQTYHSTIVNFARSSDGWVYVLADDCWNGIFLLESQLRLARPSPAEAKRHYLAKYVRELQEVLSDGCRGELELKDAARRVRLLAHYLEYALACERWIAEGRTEVPRHGEDGCPVPPNRE